MKNTLLIYIDRLEEGKEHIIEDSLDPSFMELNEKELQFKKNIIFNAKAYVANDYLVIQGKVKAYPILPCLVCNEPTESPIEIDHFYHTEKLSDIKGARFDYLELLRELILINIPHFIECSKGNCPERKNISQFLKKQEKTDATYPFNSL